MTREKLAPSIERLLLGSRRLGTSEMSARLTEATNLSYWRRLCPALTVNGSRRTGLPERAPVTAAGALRLARRLGDDGYFIADRVLAPSGINRLRDAIITLKQHDWPPVFALVYDEFWRVWHSRSIHRTLELALGRGYRMRDRLWCYYVQPVRGAKGWPPHADGYGSRALSVWLSLTDASLDNGCMYVVPRHLIGDVRVETLFRGGRVPIGVLTTLLQSTRALPAPAGSILAWQFDVLHWGSVADDGRTPRISISAEFIAARDAGPGDFVAGHRSLPAFGQRLRIIAGNLTRFAGNDVWTDRYRSLGSTLARSLDAARRR